MGRIERFRRVYMGLNDYFAYLDFRKNNESGFLQFCMKEKTSFLQTM